jgi:hypothetical protein
VRRRLRVSRCTLRYVISVAHGGGTAAATTVTEMVPEHTAYTGPAGEGWLFGPAGPVAAQVLTVAGSGGAVSVPFTVTAEVPLALDAVTITDRVETSLGRCENCTVTDRVPGFALTASVSTTTARPGDVVTYTITAADRTRRSKIPRWRWVSTLAASV